MFITPSFKKSLKVEQFQGNYLKVQDHWIWRKVSCIPNHPLRANFPETKIARYNLKNKSPAMPAIYKGRFKNTFFNRIVLKHFFESCINSL